jgi:hypothetical protein
MMTQHTCSWKRNPAKATARQDQSEKVNKRLGNLENS